MKINFNKFNIMLIAVFVAITSIFLVTALEDNGKIKLTKTATKIYDETSADNLEYGRLAKVDLSVDANPYNESTSTNGKLDIVIIFDGSGSMNGTRLTDAKEAATDFANTLLDSDGKIQIGIVEFGPEVRDTLNLTNSKTDVLNFIGTKLNAEGGTNLQSAIDRADTLLDAGAREDAKQIVITLTDGVPTFFTINGTRYGTGNSNSPVCIKEERVNGHKQCTAYQTPSGAAKESLDNLKTNYEEADVYTIVFGNEPEASSILAEVNPENANPLYKNYNALSGSDLKEKFKEIIEITKNIIGKNSIVTDTIPADFKLTNDTKTNLENSGVTVTENTDGTTTLTWNIGDIEANNKQKLSYEVEALDNYHGSMFTNKDASLTTKVDESNPYYDSTNLTIRFDTPTVEIPAITKDDHYNNNSSYIGYAESEINGTSVLTNDLNKIIKKDKKNDSITVNVTDTIVIDENENVVKNEDGTYNIYKNSVLQGTLKMNSDGTFSFQSEENIEGDISFTYHIKTKIDKSQETDYVYSNKAVVTLNIKSRLMTKINGEKIWNDNNNQDGIRPDTVTVNLLANNTVVSTKTVTESDNWNYSFDNLYVYEKGHENDNNYKIKYTLKEQAVTEGYTVSYKNTNVINSHTPETTGIQGTKTWNDNDNQDGIRPNSITVNLTGKVDGKTVYETSKDITANDNWKYSFENLPKYDKGNLITYSVSENAIANYATSYNGNNITNSHTPATININGEKIWVDVNDIEGLRPGSITLHLIANGETVKTTTATKENNWKYSFENLPKYKNGKLINYVVTEDKVDHYTMSYDQNNPYILINTHTPNNIKVEGTKTWDDTNNIYGRPNSITVNLTGKVGDKEIVSKSQTVTESDNWSYSFDNLPEYRDGKLIVYTITEDSVRDYSVSYNGYNITNTYDPETIEITGTKTWNDNDNQDGLRPDKVTINLLANGTKVDTKEVAEDNNWSFTFTDQVKYANGEEIVYTIEEVSVEGYTTEITDFDVINSHTPEVVSYKVTKNWDDYGNNDGIRPNSITVHLLKDGIDIATKEINASNNWTYSFEGLQKYRDGGILINYQIVEDAVKGYTSNIENSIIENNNTNVTITNKHELEKIDITVNKTWNDQNNKYNSRPDSIKVSLYADNVLIKTIEINKDMNWTYTFKDLIKYKDGKEIIYTIKEEGIENYTTTYDGFNIINTYKIPVLPKEKENNYEIAPPYTGVSNETRNSNLVGIILLALCQVAMISKIRKEA